jgi:hypothetical protein
MATFGALMLLAESSLTSRLLACWLGSLLRRTAICGLRMKLAASDGSPPAGVVTEFPVGGSPESIAAGPDGNRRRGCGQQGRPAVGASHVNG